MRSKVTYFFLLFIVSCGGSSSKNDRIQTYNSVNPTYPSHPIVWESISPESIGMSNQILEQAFDYAFQDGSFTQAALVIKDGNLVYERYRGISNSEAENIASSLNSDPEIYISLYGNRDVESEVTSWSTAKSFTSLLVGIAIEDGYIKSLTESASTYISEWYSDDRNTITIKNLLDMRSGLYPSCYDPLTDLLQECLSALDSSSGGNIVYSDDQMTGCINRDYAEEGANHSWYNNGMGNYSRGDFVYSNCDTMVLGEIIFRATGQDIQTYAEYNLFSKIGINANWWKDWTSNGQSNGNYLAYCCLDSTARDFAKFGKLYKDFGKWNNEVIIDSSYVVKSITPRFKESPEYGYGFWLGKWNEAKVFWMQGHLGQYVFVIPEKNVIVVRLGHLKGESDETDYFTYLDEAFKVLSKIY